MAGNELDPKRIGYIKAKDVLAMFNRLALTEHDFTIWRICKCGQRSEYADESTICLRCKLIGCSSAD